MFIPNIWKNKIHVPNHQPEKNELEVIEVHKWPWPIQLEFSIFHEFSHVGFWRVGHIL